MLVVSREEMFNVLKCFLTMFWKFLIVSILTMAHGHTVVVWGEEEQRTRYLKINGETTVETLLKSITGTSLQNLTFFDKHGIPFGDVHCSNLVNEVGHYDRDMGVWIVTIKVKQVRLLRITSPDKLL